MRACAYGVEKPLLCRQEGIMSGFPARERISDVIPVHAFNIRPTAVLVNMNYCSYQFPASVSWSASTLTRSAARRQRA